MEVRELENLTMCYLRSVCCHSERLQERKKRATVSGSYSRGLWKEGVRRFASCAEIAWIQTRVWSRKGDSVEWLEQLCELALVRTTHSGVGAMAGFTETDRLAPRLMQKRGHQGLASLWMEGVAVSAHGWIRAVHSK